MPYFTGWKRSGLWGGPEGIKRPAPVSGFTVRFMQGLHLTADLSRCHCDTVWLTDAAHLLAWCVQAVQAAQLQAVNQLAHTFPAGAHGPGGVTATVLLAESHLCVHTWPEQAAVTVDVYVCNFGADHSRKARQLMDALVALFAPEQAHRQALQRGQALPSPIRRSLEFLPDGKT